ncbi:ester cyclase [Clostridium sediminicola]|uniref:ester cyclase n=1 Tax=Clostridium sediminicola TaxID=3114879 RepID=UPI0031F21276
MQNKESKDRNVIKENLGEVTSKSKDNNLKERAVEKKMVGKVTAKSAENNVNDLKVYYGDSNEVVPFGLNDFNEFVNITESKQSMNGFEDRYRDVVDYIIKSTHRIWEEKGIGLINKHYNNSAVVHTGSDNAVGKNAVISNTMQTLHSFPDRRLLGENVIWSGNDKDGFYSSHRIMSTATNLGDSTFGPATGKKAIFRTVAVTFLHNNRVCEEWIVRDNLYIVQQLGLEPIEVAKNLAKMSKNKVPALQSTFGISENKAGQLSPQEYIPKHEGFEIGDFILSMFNKIWQGNLINEVRNYYADNAVVHFICNQDLEGYNQIQAMFISLFASCTNADVIIERVTCNKRAKENEWDVAVRWRIKGIHEGIGYFGYPSGKHIEILGVNHLRIANEKVIEEWITFDALDVLKQIYTE